MESLSLYHIQNYTSKTSPALKSYLQLFNLSSQQMPWANIYEFNASMTCAGCSQKQKTRRAAWPRNVLVTTSDPEISWSAPKSSASSWSWSYCWDLACQALQFGGSQLHQVNFKGGFVNTWSNLIYLRTYRQTTSIGVACIDDVWRHPSYMICEDSKLEGSQSEGGQGSLQDTHSCSDIPGVEDACSK